MPRVVIAAGGTAGHVVPALAVADALRAEGAEVSFLGAADRAEAELVPAAGYEIDLLRVRGLDRRNPLQAADRWPRRGRACRAAAPGAARARRRGGARRRRLRRRARRAGGALAPPAAGPHRGRPPPRAGQPHARPPRPPRLPRLPDRGPRAVRATWSPAGRSRRRSSHADRDAARERFGIAADDRCLLVFGGSQGARSINRCALEAFAGPGSERRDFHVLHISRQPRLTRRPATRSRGRHPARYTLLRYEPGLGRRARRLRSRARPRRAARSSRSRPPGRPAILVPYPHASGAPPARQRRVDGRGRGGGRDRGRRARARTAARSWRPACSAIRSGSRRCPRPPRAGPPDAADAGRARSCSVRSANLPAWIAS